MKPIGSFNDDVLSVHAMEVKSNGRLGLDRIVLVAFLEDQFYPVATMTLIPKFPTCREGRVWCDMLQVHDFYRECGIGRRLWKLAEDWLGKPLDGDACSDDGEAFLEAICGNLSDAR